MMFGLMWVWHCLVTVIFLRDTEAFIASGSFFFPLFTEPANYLSSKLGSHSRLNSKDVIVCGCLCVSGCMCFSGVAGVCLCVLSLSLPLFLCLCVCVCLVSEQICIVHKHLSCCSLLGKFCYKLKLCRCSWFCIHPFDPDSWLNLFSVCLSYCSHAL